MMKLRIWFCLFCFSLFLAVLATAQEHAPYLRLSQAQFVSLAARCAPGAPPDTLLAIAQTESDLNPNAISINRPKATARRAGHRDGELVLAKQPRDRSEAKSWLRWFSVHHYTVSIGLMQINAELTPQLHLRPEQLLDPCTNLRVGSEILISLYTDLARQIGEGFQALDTALSLYNAGDRDTGFRNGYVANVYAHINRRTSFLLQSRTP